MKKIIALLLVVLTVFALSGCNGYLIGDSKNVNLINSDLVMLAVNEIELG